MVKCLQKFNVKLSLRHASASNSGITRASKIDKRGYLNGNNSWCDIGYVSVTQFGCNICLQCNQIYILPQSYKVNASKKMVVVWLCYSRWRSGLGIEYDQHHVLCIVIERIPNLILRIYQEVFYKSKIIRHRGKCFWETI